MYKDIWSSAMSKKKMLFSFVYTLFILTVSVYPALSAEQKEPVVETSKNEGPWWIGNVIDIIAIVVGVGVLLLQINKQHRQSIKLQSTEIKKKLRLELFQTMSEILNEVTEINYGLIGLSNSIDIEKDFISNLKTTHHKQIELLTKLSVMLEQYSIVSEYLNIFKAAFLYEINRLHETFFPLRVFLSKGATTRIIRDKNFEDTLERLGTAYREPNIALMGYLRDLQIELQNILLGGLFSRRLPGRKPEDPSVIVISTEKNNIKKLRETFKEYL